MDAATGVIRDIKVQSTAAGLTATICLAGEIDLHRSPRVLVELLRLIADRPDVLIVDLSEVSYMDSSGVATLVQALQRVNGYQGRLIVAAPGEQVRSIFQITRLDSIFQIVDTAEEADRR